MQLVAGSSAYPAAAALAAASIVRSRVSTIGTPLPGDYGSVRTIQED
jgi:hypothetical protein